jgi:hypothetical protein
VDWILKLVSQAQGPVYLLVEESFGLWEAEALEQTDVG